MSNHLTAAQRATLAGLLQMRKHALERQLEIHQQGLSRVDHAHEVLISDGDDAPQRATDREIDLALSDSDLLQLLAVNRAQRRLHDKDYGLCMACGRAIPFDRLCAEPQAARCVDCESLHERKL